MESTHSIGSIAELRRPVVPGVSTPTAITAAVVISAAVIAGWFPLRASIASVFLLAGPHNWMELRYFLARTPVRPGPFGRFFVLAAAGAAVLGGLYAVIPILAHHSNWSDQAWAAWVWGWNAMLISWITGLVAVRNGIRGRDWSICLPVWLALLGLDTLAPQMLGIAIVYLHPLMALWFLDRQLGRSHLNWRPAYRLSLLLIPIVIGVLYIKLGQGPGSTENRELAMRIAAAAGSDLITAAPCRFLVAASVFLELLHYGIWVIALPLLGMSQAPWRVSRIPLVRHRLGWPMAVRLVLVLGALAVAVLWACFVVNYAATRQAYFTFAIFHVLAEVVFMLRMS